MSALLITGLKLFRKSMSWRPGAKTWSRNLDPWSQSHRNQINISLLPKQFVFLLEKRIEIRSINVIKDNFELFSSIGFEHLARFIEISTFRGYMSVSGEIPQRCQECYKSVVSRLRWSFRPIRMSYLVYWRTCVPRWWTVKLRTWKVKIMAKNQRSRQKTLEKKKSRTSGEEVYQKLRFKSWPPGLDSVLDRFGALESPQKWCWRELWCCPYLFLLSLNVYPSFDSLIPPG